MVDMKGLEDRVRAWLESQTSVSYDFGGVLTMPDVGPKHIAIAIQDVLEGTVKVVSTTCSTYNP